MRLSAQGMGAILLVGPADHAEVTGLTLAVAARSKQLVILVPAALAEEWLDAPPPSLAGRLVIASPLCSGTRKNGADAIAVLAVLVEGLKGAGRNLDRESFIKTLERVSTRASTMGPASAFGLGRRIGARGARIIRLNHDGLAYELIAPTIDPGPSTDDWPDEPGSPGP